MIAFSFVFPSGFLLTIERSRFVLNIVGGKALHVILEKSLPLIESVAINSVLCQTRLAEGGDSSGEGPEKA